MRRIEWQAQNPRGHQSKKASNRQQQKVHVRECRVVEVNALSFVENRVDTR